jgi:hypothetical protein
MGGYNIFYIIGVIVVILVVLGVPWPALVRSMSAMESGVEEFGCYFSHDRQVLF